LFTGKSRTDLPELVLNAVSNDKKIVHRQGTGSELFVPRQHHTAFLERKTDDLVIIQRPVIHDIEAKEAHALCEPAQHDIGDEFHIYSPQSNRGDVTTKTRRENLQDDSFNAHLDKANVKVDEKPETFIG
jgi:hypothetical protein